MTSRDLLERRQVWFYLAAVAVGLLLGALQSRAGDVAETLVWPVLALLLWATFTQLPLVSIRAAFRDRRFLITAVVGNFVLVPVLAWGLLHLAPADPAVRLGLLLVLLMPCTDWFITFTQLGGGDATRAAALTPITLILQLLLLPIYLRVLAGNDAAGVVTLADSWPALLVVLVPLGLAWLTQAWAGTDGARQHRVERLGWWPVPLLAVAIFLVATANASAVRDHVALLPPVVGIAAAFLAGALVLAMVLARSARLPTAQGRTLAFSLGTRNSFLVLPFALALPAGWSSPRSSSSPSPSSSSSACCSVSGSCRASCFRRGPRRSDPGRTQDSSRSRAMSRIGLEWVSPPTDR